MKKDRRALECSRVSHVAGKKSCQVLRVVARHGVIRVSKSVCYIDFIKAKGKARRYSGSRDGLFTPDGAELIIDFDNKGRVIGIEVFR